MIIGVVVLSSVGKIIYLIIINDKKPEREELIDNVRFVVNQINKKTPKMIDNITRLDSVVFNNNQYTVSYFYSLTSINKDSLDIANFHNQMKTLIYKNKEKILELDKTGSLKIKYIYNDHFGRRISEIEK